MREKNTYKISAIKPKDKRPLRRPRYTWEDNIKKVWAGFKSLRTGSRAD
jgi:hypothetical protein